MAFYKVAKLGDQVSDQKLASLVESRLVGLGMIHHPSLT